MFEIDLKRSVGRGRPEGTPGETFRELATHLGGPVGLLAVLLVALWFVNGRMDDSIASGEARVDEIRARVVENRQQLAELTGRKRVLFGVQPSEIYWSDILRLLSERLPDKMWIAKVELRSSEKPPQRTTLGIEAGVLSSESEGNLDLIGEFLSTLQDDPRYTKTFGAPVLGPVTRSGGDAHTLAFRVTLPLEKN